MRFFDYHRRHSKRRSTTRSPSVGDDLDGPVQPPSLTQFFQDASLYKQVIANPERKSFYRASENETVQDFAELVGKHLDTKDRAVAGRFARLSAEDGTWFPDNSTSSQEGSPSTSDFESFERRSSPEPLQGQSETTSVMSDTPDPPPSDGNEPTHNLTPEQVVELLSHEYGDLAPEGEEKLLMELDAALVQDVLILVRLCIAVNKVACINSEQHNVCCRESYMLPPTESPSTRPSWMSLASHTKSSNQVLSLCTVGDCTENEGFGSSYLEISFAPSLHPKSRIGYVQSRLFCVRHLSSGGNSI